MTKTKILSLEDIALLLEKQGNMDFKSIVCPNRGDDNHGDFQEVHGGLVPTVFGWACLYCDHTSTERPSEEYFLPVEVIPDPKTYQSDTSYPLEWEDGYPTDESLEQFEALYNDMSERSRLGVRQALLDIERIFEGSGVYHGISITKCGYKENGAYTIYFSTGGWSGNEAVIWAMFKWPCLKVFYQTQWKRGGHYVFQVNINS